jgi:cell division protein FtsI (penicillin-binding protein 3)
MTLRAFQLQVIQGNLWHQLAVNQTTERTELPAARGGLFDRNMRPLTVSQDKYRAFFAPAEVGDHAAAIETFRRVLELGRRDVARLDTATTGWVPLGQVSGRTKDQLESSVRTGVHFEAVPARAYPEGRLARGLLGAVGSDGAGLSGLELVFDSLLAGRPGEQVSRRDAHGALYPIRDAGSVPARSGRDVVLTIDADLQEIAESALARALRETSAVGGDVILADPATGEILALASRRDDSPYRLPAFTDPYEPGSTAKAFLFATLLQEDLAQLDEPIDVEGGTYRTPYRTITDVHEFDTLSVREVMLHSSNIGAAKLAERMEPGLQYSYLRDFGFGTPTGVETASEASGQLRRPSEWSLLSQQSLAYGYELNVTSIQLISAYGALANGGLLMRPTLVREIRNADGETEQRSHPRPLRRIVDERTANQITEVLTQVVREGSGDEAALLNIDIAGKTGTSRASADGKYSTGKYVASFVGYVPADDPQLVVLAKLEDPKTTIYGGAAAAPVSRTVMQAILAAGESGLLAGHLIQGADTRHDWATPEPEVPPYRFAANTPPRDRRTEQSESGELLVPDVRGLGLRAAAARLHEAGLEVELDDDALQRVRRSEPAPGSRVVSGSTVLLR